jgi:hypothetical protein
MEKTRFTDAEVWEDSCGMGSHRQLNPMFPGEHTFDGRAIVTFPRNPFPRFWTNVEKVVRRVPIEL